MVRVWVEDDHTLRARLTQTLDLAHRDETVAVASSVEEIVATVRAWLDAFVSGR